MELSDGVRRRLWCSGDWDKTLAELEAETIAMTDPWQRGAKLFQLGLLAEDLVPEAPRAMRLYERAWKATGDHRGALVRSRYLCRELLRPDIAARLLEIEAAHFDESSLQVQATFARIDAGQRAEAESGLAAALAKRPGDPQVALARLVLSRPGVAEEVAVIERQALAAESADPSGAAQLYLTAARRLRLSSNPGDQPTAVGVLRKAFALDARDDSIATLLEIAMGTGWAAGEFLAYTERRVAVAESDHERFELLRRSGMALVRRLGQPAQGATLLERALTLAYERRVTQVPRHGATLRVLRATLDAAGELPRYLDLIDRGLAVSISDDEALFLAMQGHQTASKLGDSSRVSRYASRIEALEPNNPLAARRGQAADTIDGDAVGVVVAAPPPPQTTLRATPVNSAVVNKLLSRRKNERAEFHEAVVVKCSAQLEVKRAGGAASSMINAIARDISRGGVFVLSEGRFLSSEHLEITVMIPGEEEWSLEHFKVRAQVVRIDPGVGVGCRFVEPAPELLAAIDKLIAARGVKD